MELTPIVIHQYIDAEQVETHVFPDGNAFQAWLDSQETNIFIEVEPRDEYIALSGRLA